MSTEATLRNFNKVCRRQMAVGNPTDEIRIAKILRLIGRNKKVLDVGCFEGSVSGKIMKNGNEVYGLDADGTAVEETRKKGIKAIQHNLEERWPHKDSSFDVVFAGEVIEHLFDTDKFLEEVKRALKPDGFLVLTTPNLASLGRRFLLLLGKNPFVETSLRDRGAVGHIRYFTKDSLFMLLRRHGFRVVRFESTLINFSESGSFYSRRLAKVFPSLGGRLIVKCRLESSSSVDFIGIGAAKSGS